MWACYVRPPTAFSLQRFFSLKKKLRKKKKERKKNKKKKKQKKEEANNIAKSRHKTVNFIHSSVTLHLAPRNCCQYQLAKPDNASIDVIAYAKKIYHNPSNTQVYV